MTIRTAAFAAVVAAAAGVASALPANATSPASIFIAEDSFVTIEFVSYSAGWTGTLYSTSHAGPETSALGMPLFTNKTATPGERRDLGFVPGGTSLMFAYDVTTGRKNTFRMDAHATANMFATAQTSATSWTLFVEDWVGGDEDYNDAVFNVIAEPVPAPAALATAGLCLLGSGLRRRR